MEISTFEQNGVIIRRFSGSVCFQDIINAWNLLFTSYHNLEDYKGILHSYLDAEFEHKDVNLNELVDYLKNHLDQLEDLKIAVVMDTPAVTHTIIMGRKVNSLQIKPFSTVEAALQWIEH